MVFRLHFVVVVATLLLPLSGFSGEGMIAVYATNSDSGSLAPVLPDIVPKKGQGIQASAKGPVGSTLVIVPFFHEAPLVRLAPTLAKQRAAEDSLSFPLGENEEVLSFEPGDPTFDLYVAFFPAASTELAAVEETVRSLNAALKAEKADVAELYAMQLKETLDAAVRKSSGIASAGGFGDLKLDIREVPAGKAAVSRGNTDPKLDSDTETVESNEGADSTDWSHKVSIGLVSPSVKVFPFSSRQTP